MPAAMDIDIISLAPIILLLLADQNASVKSGDGGGGDLRHRGRRDLDPHRQWDNHHGQRRLQERRSVHISRRSRECRPTLGAIQVKSLEIRIVWGGSFQKTLHETFFTTYRPRLQIISFSSYHKTYHDMTPAGGFAAGATNCSRRPVATSS